MIEEAKDIGRRFAREIVQLTEHMSLSELGQAESAFEAGFNEILDKYERFKNDDCC